MPARSPRMRTLCAFPLLVALAAGCGPTAEPGPDAVTGATLLPRAEALPLVRAFIEADAQLSQHGWLRGEPFYVGPWQGYVELCDEKGLIHTGGFGGDVSGLTFVVYRMAFTPMGGGREDFFTVDPATKKVTHIRGLVGR